MDIEKLKRVTIVAEEFARQRLCWQESLTLQDPTWGYIHIMICNNFYDIALLNWAHLFGNIGDSLHFKNTLPNPESFKSALQDNLGMKQCLCELGTKCDCEWAKHWQAMKNFRDTRIAHIDKVQSAYVPDMDIAYICVCEYYRVAVEYLKEQEKMYRGMDSSLDSYFSKSSYYYSTNVARVFAVLDPIE